MPRLTPEGIEDLARHALVACGATDANAAPVARAIRRAEMDGLGQLGLRFLPVYLTHLRSGRVDGQAVPVVTRPAAGVVRVDGSNGLAHPAIEAGRAVLADAAHAAGSAVMAIQRSYSAGALGHTVEDLAEQGLVALGFTNGPANIAPWGGFRAVYGTNPLAIAVPRAGFPPLVLDQSSSVVARVTLDAAIAAGGPLPAGWALDATGQPTTDPDAARNGSMSPAGGVRGAGIALLVELLAGALGGANFSFEMQGYGVASGPPMNVGQFFLAIDPGPCGEGFGVRVEELFTMILSQPGTRLPGDRRLTKRAEAAQLGVIVDPALINRIHSLAS
jgi:(2R)-3-sulfolactate dehydrogenase (NADP+)